MTGYERITKSSDFDGVVRETHEYRYKVASKYTINSDIVVDAACGSGYAKNILNGIYIGVDLWPEDANIVADLQTWVPDFEYDVFVSIETIEHLIDYTQHIKNAKKAKKYIIASTPIVPTVVRHADGSVNLEHYHVHDFTFDELKGLFNDENWELIHSEIQPPFNTQGIVVFKRI